MELIEQIRSQDFTAPVSCETRSGGFFRHHLSQSLQEKKQRVVEEGRIYSILGIVDGKVRYSDLLADAYGDRVGGFYDPDQKTLFLLSSEPKDRLLRIQTHELTHALQDQKFSLKDFLADSLSSDAQLAHTALIEGEANAVSYQAQGSLKCETRNLEQLLRIIARRKFTLAMDESISLRALMDFPYFFGLAYVCKVLEQGGWSELDRLYLQPPADTSTVISRISGEDVESRLQEISSADVEGVRARMALPVPPEGSIRRDVMGRFFLFALLVKTLSVEEAFVLASAWRADHLEYSSAQGRSRSEELIWIIRWSTPEAADRFKRVYFPTLREERYRIDVVGSDSVLSYSVAKS